MSAAIAHQDGWPELCAAAFKQSGNAMVLLDERRRHGDVNGAYLKLVRCSGSAPGPARIPSSRRWGTASC